MLNEKVGKKYFPELEMTGYIFTQIFINTTENFPTLYSAHHFILSI